MDNNSLSHEALRAQLLDAALTHVSFDGWGLMTFQAAVQDSGVAPEMARLVCPRGALDLAVAYHKRGDAEMLARLAAMDLSALRFREKVVAAVRARLEVAEREAVRRGVALFALPQNALHGAPLIWGTADAIWKVLGDTSEDINWYSKRAILSGVYSATVLFWLGDTSPGSEATWEFLDRRIEEVMRFETFKAKVRENKALMGLLAVPNWLAGQIKAPRGAADDLPGGRHK